MIGNRVVRKNFFVRDMVGNTRIVLEGNTIRSYFEYEPFGEKIETASGGAGDRTSFIGKELDGENFLSDFGVRKYQEDVGRFMQAEPLWELNYRWSPWAYSFNNPINAKDNNGYWVGWVHEAIIRQAASGLGLSKAQIETMVQASYDLDSHENGPGDQHKHAMVFIEDVKLYGYEVAKQKAEEKMNNFINQNFNEGTFKGLGIAVHTIEDSKAPSHKGFQVYSGWNNPDIFAHFIGDLDLPRNEAEYQEAIKETREKMMKWLFLHRGEEPLDDPKYMPKNKPDPRNK